MSALASLLFYEADVSGSKEIQSKKLQPNIDPVHGQKVMLNLTTVEKTKVAKLQHIHIRNSTFFNQHLSE